MSFSQTINYDNASNFTFNTSLLEISGSVGKLKDLRPTGAIFGAKLTAMADGNWGDGPLTGTAVGSPTYSSSTGANLTGGGTKYIEWNAGSKSDVSPLVGCRRFTVTPAYTGNPANARHFYMESQASGFIQNMINVQHLTGGNIRLIIYDSSATLIMSVNLGSWSPTAGVSYVFELNFDVQAGATRLFIDGVQLGSTQTGTGTRTTSIGIIRVGTNHTTSETANHHIKDVVIFSTVQHTTNFSVGSLTPVPVTPYDTTAPYFTSNAPITTDDIESLSESVSVSGSDSVKYVFLVDDIPKYYNGSAWVTSNNSSSQSNTAAQLTDEVLILLVNSEGNGAEVQLRTLLVAATGQTTPEITSNVIEYNFFDFQDSISTCLITGYLMDAENNPVTEGVLSVTTTEDYIVYGDTFIPKKAATVEIRDNGYFEIELIETESVEKTYDFKFSFTSRNQAKNLIFEAVQVPDEAMTDFTDLLSS